MAGGPGTPPVEPDCRLSRSRRKARPCRNQRTRPRREPLHDLAAVRSTPALRRRSTSVCSSGQPHVLSVHIRPPTMLSRQTDRSVSRPACGHHRFYAAVLSPRPRAVVARARYLAMLVAATRLRASECRAENRAIAVALMITGFRRWFADVQPAQLTRSFKAKLFNRLRETAECMAADGRQKPCLCPPSRRSLTRSVIPAPRRPSPP